MINEVVLNYILLFIFLEIYELQWQKAQTIMGMLARMYQHYSKSIFLFLIMHPTFYFAIGFMVLNDYNIYAVTLLLIKSLDMITKISLIKQVFIDENLSDEMTLALLAPINKFILYMGLVIYLPLIYLSLESF
ncbi:hypothetical protein [Sulfurimonas sp.]|uniref:hypothetical protein n=1 Tax=Sulfurimonas sp. TaxID=2022749 RepID=UPI002B479528|nr:hypothetical protein [Sulfurimonas sp.]